MIFVTVGTHEQPFDRLLKQVDQLKGKGFIRDEVVMQTGFSDYQPRYCRWQRAFPYQEMQRLAADARILITHGGPASCSMFWQQGRIPIVVPRQKRFGEHVNDHQLIFCRRISEIWGNVIVIEDIDELAKAISGYETLSAGMLPSLGQNSCFVERFQQIADELTGTQCGNHRKPKIGILSMQRIANHGSVLQAYALKHMIEELGRSVQFVDYHPGCCLTPTRTGLIRKLEKAADGLRVDAPLRERLRYILSKKNFSRRSMAILGLDRRRNYAPELDLLIIGSDEVFNCTQENANVGFSPELFGEGHRSKRLISYAASFGNTTLKKLAQYGKCDAVASYLERFDALSVRDANSSKIVAALTKEIPEIHMDPVIAGGSLDIFADASLRVPSGFLLLYGYTGRFSRSECAEIRQYADSKGLKIYCIGGIQHCCDQYVDCNSFEAVAYFKAADCVVTDTFHGTALAVMAHRKFGVFVRSDGYGNSEKLEDLLARLQMKDRAIRTGELLSSKLDGDIDFSVSDEVIRFEAARAREYLRKWVEQMYD